MMRMFVALMVIATAAVAETHSLKPTPQTVAWGHYDASTPPVLRVHSGDIVEVQTLITSSPARLEAAGVPPDQVEQSLRDIYRDVKDKGPGGHILTGPIFVEGAEPGDVLEIRIQKIDLAIPYAYNGFRPGRGFLPEDFPYSRMKIIPLDRARMIARFAPGIEIPLRPFFGSIGVAPPENVGRIDSAPPWVHGGNLDNKELVAGTTLYLPVHALGALLQIGDGHAGQGNGEVDITAMETSLIGTFQLIVRKDLHVRWPRAETPAHYVTIGVHEDLTEAAKMAVREMIDYLTTDRHLSRDDAYMLTSVAADLSISELVDGNKGVHMMIPKEIFTKTVPDRAGEVRQTEIAFAKAFADRDPAKFFGFLSDDTNFLSAKRTLAGKSEVVKSWSEYFSNARAPFRWQPERVVVNGKGDLGLSTGPIYDAGGKHIGNYSSIWQRQGDGTWKIVFDGPGAPVCQ